MESGRDKDLGEQIMSRASAGILDDHRSRRLEQDHWDGIHGATAVGNERAVLPDAGHRNRPAPQDGIMQIRQPARHVMLCG
jgi:hypothetical protein